MSPRAEFLRRGWARFGVDAGLTDWAAAVRASALATAEDPDLQDTWLRHGATWFAGVNVLANDAQGRVDGRPPVSGPALDLARDLYGDLPLDPGQVSVVYPGYPRRDPDESEAAHRFRRLRDAAHVDGMKARGPDRRRHLGERHAYILGLPVTASAGAPLVVWEGSHEVMRRAFSEALRGSAPENWADVDLTDTYHAARREAFETCPRLELPARPGEATLVHRLALHGVAPWGAEARTEARAVIYFRPELPGPANLWLDAA